MQDRGKITECGHFFHHKCLKEWIQTQQASDLTPSCPICRKGLSSEDAVAPGYSNRPNQYRVARVTLVYNRNRVVLAERAPAQEEQSVEQQGEYIHPVERFHRVWLRRIEERRVRARAARVGGAAVAVAVAAGAVATSASATSAAISLIGSAAAAREAIGAYGGPVGDARERVAVGAVTGAIVMRVVIYTLEAALSYLSDALAD